MSNDVKAFRANIDAIIEQYEQLAAENAKLRNENAILKAKISMLQKSQEKSQPPQVYTQNDIITKQQRRRVKTRLQVNWVPIQYDFTDSVLCVHRYDETLAFGTADANVILFNTNFNSVQNINSSDNYNNTDGFRGSSINYPQIVVPFAQYRGHSGAINCIVADPKTELFATCSGDGTTHIWSCLLNNSVFTSQQHRLSTDSDNSSIENIKSNLILSHHSGPVLSASWLMNGQLVTGSSDSTVCLWDVTHSQNFTHSEKLPSSVICTDAPRNVISISTQKKRSGTTNSSNSVKSMISKNSSPIVGYAAGLANGETRFFDPRTNGSVLSVAHSKGMIVSCKFATCDIKNMIFNGLSNTGSEGRSNPTESTSMNTSQTVGNSNSKKKKKRPSSINLLFDDYGSLNGSLNKPTKSTNGNNDNTSNSALQAVSNSSLTNLTNLNNMSDFLRTNSVAENNEDFDSSPSHSSQSSSYSFVTAGSDKTVRVWDLRAPQDYLKSFDVDHVPTKIDMAGPYIAVSTEAGNPRFINLARNTVTPLANPPFSYTVSSCAFAADDASSLVMASWDGTAAVMRFETKSV